MRPFLIILLSIICFSCKTNYYLSDPIKSIPTFGLQPNLNSNGILVASDANLTTDTAYFENCLRSLRVYVEAKSNIKIIDEIFFHKSPNIAILTELKTKYNVDGLLLLINLSILKNSFDVPSGKFAYSGRMPKPYFRIYKTSIPWTNVNVKITSHWEYYDFTTGKSYMFTIKYDEVLELGEQVSDVDSYIEKNFEVLDPLFYQNGSLTASKLIGLNH